MIECSMCKRTLPRENYSPKRNSATIIAKRCNECRAKPAVTWNERNPDRVKRATARFVAAGKARVGRLKARYGMSQSDYDAMLAAQGGKCAICGTTTPGGRFTPFQIDHCHDSGKVRGLLCTNCNRALGYFGDDPDRIMAAARYLRTNGR